MEVEYKDKKFVPDKATKRYVSEMWYDVAVRGYRFKSVDSIEEADKWKKEDVPQMSGGFWVSYKVVEVEE